MVCGGDNNAQALVAAQKNMTAAGVEGCLHCWDARALLLADGSVDRIICNLPWGRQVQVEGTLDALYRHIVTEMRRVLMPTRRIVLLTNAPQAVDPLDFYVVEQREISLFGQRPTILLLALSLRGG